MNCAGAAICRLATFPLWKWGFVLDGKARTGQAATKGEAAAHAERNWCRRGLKQVHFCGEKIYLVGKPRYFQLLGLQ